MTSRRSTLHRQAARILLGFTLYTLAAPQVLFAASLRSAGDRPFSRTLPDGKSESALFATNGNLISRTDFMGRTISYDYDPETNLVTARHYPDGSAVNFTYTVTGRRKTVVDSRGTTTYGYDNRDRIASLTYPDGRKIEYTYNENGARASLKATVGARVFTTTYDYDDLNRLSVVAAEKLSKYSPTRIVSRISV